MAPLPPTTGMKLMSSNIAQNIPSLYSTEKLPLAEKTVQLKWFAPWSNWTWWVVEYDPTERIAWGIVAGHETEWGYFSLDELEAIRGRAGLTIERDIHFVPCTVAALVKRERLDMAL